MEKYNSKKIFAWAAALIWMVIIFGLSSMKGGASQGYDPFYFIERKTFHVIEYFILASLLYWAFLQNFFFDKAIWFSVACAFLSASSDEWHQTFVFGREGTPRDVLIDLIGIFLMTVVVLKFKLGKKYVLGNSGKNSKN